MKGIVVKQQQNRECEAEKNLSTDYMFRLWWLECEKFFLVPY